MARRPGRPSKYKPEHAPQAAKLCRLGATDKELAEFFGVSESTLNLWKAEYAEFSESLKQGKQEADGRVEQSLYRRALGYSHDAIKIMTVGNDVQKVPYVEHYPPDTTACIFWLKNRKPTEWRDVKAVELNRPLEGLSDEQLAIVAEQLRSTISAEGDREGDRAAGKPQTIN
jgi:hypothetical protein